MATDTITRRNRQTGTHITIQSCAAVGIEPTPGECRWFTTCEEHEEAIAHPTKALAVRWAAEPATWCSRCQHPHDEY